jgi:hypothetical protein
MCCMHTQHKVVQIMCSTHKLGLDLLLFPSICSWAEAVVAATGHVRGDGSDDVRVTRCLCRILMPSWFVPVHRVAATTSRWPVAQNSTLGCVLNWPNVVLVPMLQLCCIHIPRPFSYRKHDHLCWKHDHSLNEVVKHNHQESSELSDVPVEAE